MILDRLNINRVAYGPDKGKYKAEVSYEGSSGSVGLKLSPELSNELLKCCGEAILKYSKEAAKDLNVAISESLKDVT